MASKTPSPSNPKKSHQLNIGNDDLVRLILRILDEEKYYNTKRMLEKESRVYFSIEHIEHVALKGDWDEVENYISAFIKLDDCHMSTGIFSLIRKHKFFEALDRGDRTMAWEILNKEAKFYAKTFPENFKRMIEAFLAKNFRQNPLFSNYGDINQQRTKFSHILKELIKSHHLLKEKLDLPKVHPNILRTLFKELKQEDFLKKNSSTGDEILDHLLDLISKDSSLDALSKDLPEF